MLALGKCINQAQRPAGASLPTSRPSSCFPRLPQLICQMLLHKLLPFAVPKPAFFQLNSTTISYAEILQRSRRELVSRRPAHDRVQLHGRAWYRCTMTLPICRAPPPGLTNGHRITAPALHPPPTPLQLIFKAVLAAAAAAAAAALWRNAARPALAALGWA